MNATTLFAYLRRAPFGGKLTQSQIDGVTRLLSACARHSVSDIRQRANVLAQVFRETGGRMQPVRETFAVSDAQAISRLDAAWSAGKLPTVKAPYWRKGWFGRGDIQITHEFNYRKAEIATGHPLTRKPSLALDPTISADIAVIGMKTGMFTGARLVDFFNDTKDDPIGARRIVNGKDKAALIAGYHRNFLDALTAAEEDADAEGEPIRKDVTEDMAKPDDVAPQKSPGLWTAITTFLGGTVSLGFLGEINNGYALAGLGLVLTAGAVGVWLVGTGRVTFNRVQA